MKAISSALQVQLPTIIVKQRSCMAKFMADTVVAKIVDNNCDGSPRCDPGTGRSSGQIVGSLCNDLTWLSPPTLQSCCEVLQSERLACKLARKKFSAISVVVR